MPRYEYACACGERVVRRCTMQEVSAVVSCEACQGTARRIFSAPHVKTASLYSEVNKRGLAEIDATRRTDERVYARNWDRPIPEV